jgi:hypothetical protein
MTPFEKPLCPARAKEVLRPKDHAGATLAENIRSNLQVSAQILSEELRRGGEANGVLRECWSGGPWRRFPVPSKRRAWLNPLEKTRRLGYSHFFSLKT